MSHYNDFETEITDQAALVRALCRCENRARQQIQLGMVETHTDPQHLYGYQGDRRNQKAHVIIRQQYVGSASNDIGFVKNEDGKYAAIISDFDSSHYNKPWLTKLYTYYNVEKTKLEFENRGIAYTETQDDKGRIQLRAKFKAENTSRIQVRR